MEKDLVPILPGYDEKVGTMKVSPQFVRDAEQAGYAHYMAQMLSASEAQREENKRLAEIRKKRHGIDPFAQAASTQAILARPKEDDLKHFLRPLPTKAMAQIVDKDGNIDVGERAVTAQEVIAHKAMQRAEKNTIGQSEKSSVSEEKKEVAIHAFVCSPPAQLTPEERQRVTQITPYSKTPELPIEPEKSQSLSSRFKHWLWRRGLPVHKVTRNGLSLEEADKT